MKPRFLLQHLRVLALALVALSSSFAARADLAYADKPLFYAAGVEPNVALLIDNSTSMSAADTGGTGTITSVCNGATLTQPLTRMNAAKEAACQVVQDNAGSMRIGLYRFNTTSGTYTGVLLNDFGVADIPTMKTSISGISANASGTPLAEAYRTVSEKYLGANSPIQYRCQKNYTVLFTDGQPSAGIDTNNSITLPAASTAQASTWNASTMSTGSAGGSPSWDGFAEPRQWWNYFGGGGNCDPYSTGSNNRWCFYAWLDDLSQLMYDVDIKNTGSAGLPAALCGGTASAAGTDCSGKSWNDPAFTQQNVITYTVGLGVEANNEMMRDTPLVNRISVVPSDVDVGADTINIPAHGLKDGDYVHYYTTYRSNWSTTGTGDTGADSITGADTTNMPANVRVYYNDNGGAPLQYSGMVNSNACGEIGGLTMGDTYYLTSTGGNTLKLADTKANAITCRDSGTNCRDITGLGEVGTVHSFNRASQAPYAPTLANTNTSGTSPINPTANTLTYASNHSFLTGDAVTYTCSMPFSGNCTIPGLVRGNTYYVAVISPTVVKLASSDTNAVSCANSATNCIDFTGYPTTAGRTQSLTRAAVTALGPKSLTATGSGTTPVNTGTEQLTVTSHGFATGNAVTYSCAVGINTVPGNITVTSSTALYAKSITPTTFQLSLTAGGTTLNLVDGGNAAQNFSWTNTVGLAGIGGLKPYETDDAPTTANPDYTSTTAANRKAYGKYFVTLDTVDPENKIKLHECGGSQTLDADPGAPNFPVTLYCYNGKTTAVDLTSQGSGTLSTGPGESYFSMTTAQLVDSLKAAFAEIRAVDLSFGTLGSNTSTEFSEDTRLYQARFNTADWSGDVRTYKLAGNEIDPVPEWEASNKLPDHAARTILTRNGTNGAFDFTETNWGKLTGTQQTSLSNGGGDVVGKAVLNWTRGQDVATYRSRTNGKIGDILNSGLTYVGAPDELYANVNYGLPASNPGKATYNAFKAKARTPMVYGGSNGGMLHGFDASLIDATEGVEKVAFIPEAVYMDWNDVGNNGVKDAAEPAINKFYEVARPYYGIVADQEHHYFVNATPETGDAFFTTARAGLDANEWHTVLVGGLGKGGRSVYALDITDDTFNASDVLWEFNDSNSGDMGYSYGQPAIALLDNGKWVAIFGNGYDSRNDQARIFVVNIEDGSLIQQFDLGSDPDNGVASVTVLNSYTTADGVTAQAVYAGDLQGNVWKVDLTGAAGFTAATAITVTTPFFVAEDDAGNRQAITSAITLNRYPSVQSQGVMLFFGTGSYFTDADKGYDGTPKYDAMYGIWDDNVSNVSITDLVEQQMGSIALDPDGDGVTTDYRTATQNPVDYVGPPAQRGWYMKLAVTVPAEDFKGERVVFAPRTVATGSYVLFTTVIPADVDPCASGGSSNFYALDATTGGAKPYAVFDLNDDGVFDASDDGGGGVVGFGAEGLASGVAVFDDGSAVKVIVNDEELDVTGLNGGDPDPCLTNPSLPQCCVSPPCTCPDGSSPPCSTLKSGRMSWRQLQ